MNPREFAGTVVIAAANRWDGVRMADRQLAERLSRHVPVLYVDPPESVVSRYRERGQRGGFFRKKWLRRIGPGLAHLTPEVLPGMARPGVAGVNTWAIAKQVQWAIAQLGGSVHSTIEANILMPVMGRCGEKQSIYWAQDDFVGMASLTGQSSSAFARAEALVAAKADIIIAANPSVAETLQAQGYAPVLIPYGCDVDVFGRAHADASPAQGVHLSRPMAVFMGHLGDRIDLDILEEVAKSKTSLLMVGPLHPRTDVARFEAILAQENIQWVGEQAFEELPNYLAHADVGILPYTQSKFNIGSFPLKTLEYLAAALPVVSTNLPAISWLECSHIDVAETPSDFSEAVAARLLTQRDAAGDGDRRAFAAKHSWESRARAFLEAMNLPTSLEGSADSVVSNVGAGPGIPSGNPHGENGRA